MATYTAIQLRGKGTPVEAISGNKTFLFGNPLSSSAYFTIETTKTGSKQVFDASSPTNAIGTYGNFTNMDSKTLITSSYVASIEVPPGVTSFDFNPTVAIVASSSFLRTTGDTTLSIS
tara:strand:+ start:279 stop:632 length:354 start_codon:yes stop_codon:yes gene_type:complete